MLVSLSLFTRSLETVGKEVVRLIVLPMLRTEIPIGDFRGRLLHDISRGAFFVAGLMPPSPGLSWRRSLLWGVALPAPGMFPPC